MGSQRVPDKLHELQHPQMLFGSSCIGRQVAVMGWPCRDNISQDDIDQLKNAMTTHAENTKRDQPVLCKEPWIGHAQTRRFPPQ
jgi:hypothetical protein